MPPADACRIALVRPITDDPDMQRRARRRGRPPSSG
ncbi:MAG: CbbQ/NirQ/NorQ C-terminal domain-containing protein [Rhodopseudomonas palustris]|nr:CbbQ/NirQ/NorQ C-terminal domain-containing protein [Rhodopseudomonas palustris]